MAERRTIRTMCPMSCHPTLCGMLVEVEGERLVGIRGDADNPDSRGFLCYNERGEFRARALVTDRVPAGTVWMRDGWEGLNRLTSGSSCIPDEAVDLFGFSAGQASFDAMVEVAAADAPILSE